MSFTIVDFFFLSRVCYIVLVEFAIVEFAKVEFAMVELAIVEFAMVELATVESIFQVYLGEVDE